jgi:hypothetical protein
MHFDGRMQTSLVHVKFSKNFILQKFNFFLNFTLINLVHQWHGIASEFAFTGDAISCQGLTHPKTVSFSRFG